MRIRIASKTLLLLALLSAGLLLAACDAAGPENE